MIGHARKVLDGGKLGSWDKGRVKERWGWQERKSWKWKEPDNRQKSQKSVGAGAEVRKELKVERAGQQTKVAKVGGGINVLTRERDGDFTTWPNEGKRRLCHVLRREVGRAGGGPACAPASLGAIWCHSASRLSSPIYSPPPLRVSTRPRHKPRHILSVCPV